MRNWRGVLLGGGTALAIAGAGLWFGGSGASGAGEARMEFVPGSSNVSLSEDSFELEVKLSNVNNLGAWGLIVEFDNEALEYLGTSTTQFLGSTGRQTFAPCPSTQPSVANQYGAFRMDCASLGIVEDGVGKMGPSGTGIVGKVRLRPKSAGTTYLTFQAKEEGTGYVIVPADPAKWPSNPLADEEDPDYGESGKTGISEVEVCTNGECAPYDVEFEAIDAVINIYDPNGPTPTGVPATPTPRPTQNVGNAQATAQAVLTPSARLTARAGTVASGNTGGTGTTRPGSGSGTSGARLGIGPDGAPIAGYGPQEEQSSEWPARAGMVLAAIGAVAVIAGVTARTRSRE